MLSQGSAGQPISDRSLQFPRPVDAGALLYALLFDNIMPIFLPFLILHYFYHSPQKRARGMVPVTPDTSTRDTPGTKPHFLHFIVKLSFLARP